MLVNKHTEINLKALCLIMTSYIQDIPLISAVNRKAEPGGSNSTVPCMCSSMGKKGHSTQNSKQFDSKLMIDSFLSICKERCNLSFLSKACKLLVKTIININHIDRVNKI